MTFRKRGTTTVTIQASMLPITMNINSFQKARCSGKMRYFNIGKATKIQTVIL